MKFTEFRLKIRRWFRKYKKVICIVFIAWLSVYLINTYLTNRPMKTEPKTTYEAHKSIMDSSSKTPTSLKNPIEEKIKEYVGYCNDGNFEKAFSLISEGCRKHEFNNNIDKFMEHVFLKMPTKKVYAIQSYSNVQHGNKKIYIYEVKYTDDFLATGLTNTMYSYTYEKMAFYTDDDGNLQMNVGNYICYDDIKSISENEYLKIDVIDRTADYEEETYQVKLTNRSNYTVVIADGAELNEIVISLPNEIRTRVTTGDIVLKPQEVMTYRFKFKKFIDDGDETQNLLFSSIRVMENYSGTGDNIPEEVIQSEIDNAISKFSMTVTVNK